MKITNIEQEMKFPINMGISASFEIVYRSYFQPLRYFISKTISVDDAEDLLEDLFVKLWNKRINFESEIHLRAFLYRSAENAKLDFLKSHRIVKTDQLENQDLKEFESYGADMIQAEVYGELYRSINDLPTQCRKVVSLSFIEGLSNSEIAKQLGLSEQSVKNTKVRGVKIIKKSFPNQTLLLAILIALEK